MKRNQGFARSEEFERRYLSGDDLWGDDLEATEVAQWVADEAEAYARLEGAEHSEGEEYWYHWVNQIHGLKHLPKTRFSRTLGIGSAFGAEFEPLANRIDELVVIEPSLELRSSRIGGLVPQYVAPAPDGKIPFPDGRFDLVSCLGVLHHIPNVSTLLSEIARVTAPDGWLIIREPAVSMGDWRGPRQGVTARERGIPVHWMLTALQKNGFSIVSRSMCTFPVTHQIGRICKPLQLRTRAGARLDAALSKAFSWNYRYHARTPLQKLRPTSCFYVARRSSTGTPGTRDIGRALDPK